MTAYRLWPATSGSGTATAFTGNIGMQFSLSSAQPLTAIWIWSPSGATQLPTAIGIWVVSGTSLVPGTHLTSPSWSGAAGSGWVKCAYNGSVTLAASTNYKVAASNSGSGTWYAPLAAYWTTGAGTSGLTSGPITAPNSSSSVSGQDTFAGSSSFVYPASSGVGTNYWIDVQVGIPAGALLASFP